MNDWQFHTGAETVADFFALCPPDELAIDALAECAEYAVEDAGKAAAETPLGVDDILDDLVMHLADISGWERMTCGQVAAAAKALGI
jgi:hypothetical protein